MVKLLMQSWSKRNNMTLMFIRSSKKTALSHKWPADSKAPAKQVGFVVLILVLGNK